MTSDKKGDDDDADGDDDDDSADDEYSELRKQCFKQAKADRKLAQQAAKNPSSPGGKKITKAEKAQIKADHQAAKEQCEALFPK